MCPGLSVRLSSGLPPFSGHIAPSVGSVVPVLRVGCQLICCAPGLALHTWATFPGPRCHPLLPAVSPFPACGFSASLPQSQRPCHLCWKLVFLLKAVSLTPQATHRPLQGPLVVEWLRLDWVVCMGLAPTGRDTVQPWVLPGPTCGQVRLWTGALTG